MSSEVGLLHTTTVRILYFYPSMNWYWKTKMSCLLWLSPRTFEGLLFVVRLMLSCLQTCRGQKGNVSPGLLSPHGGNLLIQSLMVWVGSTVRISLYSLESFEYRVFQKDFFFFFLVLTRSFFCFLRFLLFLNPRFFLIRIGSSRYSPSGSYCRQTVPFARWPKVVSSYGRSSFTSGTMPHTLILGPI